MHTKWMYAGTSPYAPAGGVEQLQIDREDLLQTCLRKGVEQKFVQGKWLAEAKASFKDIFPTPEDILRETRKAGYLANKRAAAAAAFVLQDSRRDFSNVGKAWTGLCDQSSVVALAALNFQHNFCCQFLSFVVQDVFSWHTSSIITVLRKRN